MKTVKQISRITGVSIRTLHHYDAIGLLKPSAVTESGYRLYDDAALERLCLIIIYRELDFPLKKIAALLNAPDFDRNQVLEEQIRLLEEKRRQLQNRITLARGIQQTGVKFMKPENIHTNLADDYQAQAKAMWGNTDAYREYETKSKGRTRQDEQHLGDGLMALFTELGAMRSLSPDSETVQSWVTELRGYITANYYNCTVPILQGLGQMYAGGGSMTETIDKAGGDGTGAFACEAITIYCQNHR